MCRYRRATGLDANVSVLQYDNINLSLKSQMARGNHRVSGPQNTRPASLQQRGSTLPLQRAHPCRTTRGSPEGCAASKRTGAEGEGTASVRQVRSQGSAVSHPTARAASQSVSDRTEFGAQRLTGLPGLRSASDAPRMWVRAELRFVRMPGAALPMSVVLTLGRGESGTWAHCPPMLYFARRTRERRALSLTWISISCEWSGVDRR